VVVPCFNEEEVIQETHQQLSATLRKICPSFEIIYVNDGSRDRTLELLRNIQAEDPHVRYVSLARNFGHQKAVSAGIDYARGQAVVLIDADLQDPPEVIEHMLIKWQEGFDVIYGVRAHRQGESWFKLVTARMFYRMLNQLSEVPIPLDTGDFRLMDRKVVDVLKAMPERDRFLRGMVAWIGFNQVALPYERAPRFAGESKYPLRKMLAFALDGILSFSSKPLRTATLLGFFTSGLAIMGILYSIFVRLFTSSWVSGWAMTFIANLFMGGVQLLCIGVIGEYIGRIYAESKHRPLYLVSEARGDTSQTQVLQ
jgi:dolichol-phosphate mannosyltransferase